MATWIDELAKEALAGDQAAWKRLYGVLTPRLWALHRKWGVDDSECADLVQETWIRVLQYPHYDETRQFEPYIFTIATNVVRDWHRRRKSACSLEDEPVSSQPPLEEGVERVELVRKVLETLTDEERTILVLRFWYGMTIKQIADERLEASENSIKSKCYRAMQKLAPLIVDCEKV